jgi:predicted ester cyclase
MAESANFQLVQLQIAALNARDVEGYLQRIDPGYGGASEIMPGPILGPEGVRQVVDLLFTAFPDLRIEVEQLFESGDNVIARLRLTGTHKGNFAGVAPTGKSVSWQACDIVRVRNGKVRWSKLYADNVSLLGQLGVLTLPRATTAG